eukprot:746332-Hanusia_phi.AAC.20
MARVPFRLDPRGLVSPLVVVVLMSRRSNGNMVDLPSPCSSFCEDVFDTGASGVFLDLINLLRTKHRPAFTAT